MKVRHLRLDDLRGLRWRGLVRESSEEQADRWSPERQRSDLRRAAGELGMLPVEPLFYERVGSGESENTPELEQALRDGIAGHYDVLVVLHTSRFARNRAEAVRVKREFQKAGIVIYFVAQRIISGTYAGSLTEGINEVIDEHENETRRMWVAGGLRERQLAGRWVGVIPYGYRKHLADFPDGSRGWDGTLEVDPDEAPVVRDIFARLGAASSTQVVALHLNAAGHRTRNGLPWDRTSVWKIATNPAYAGEAYRYRGRDPRHYYDEGDAQDGRRQIPAPPAIVAPGLATEVRRLLKERRTRSPERIPGGGYPLSKVLRCGRCGSRMTGVESNDVRYYRCVARARRKACDGPHIPAKIAEGAFARWLGTLTLPADWRKEVARLSLNDAKGDELARRAALEERQARLKKLYTWGDIAEDVYLAEKRELQLELGVIAKPNVASIEAVAAALEHLGTAWEAQSRADKATLPALLLKEAVVEDRNSVTFYVRAELRAILDLCASEPVAWDTDPAAHYEVRFVA